MLSSPLRQVFILWSIAILLGIWFWPFPPVRNMVPSKVEHFCHKRTLHIPVQRARADKEQSGSSWYHAVLPVHAGGEVNFYQPGLQVTVQQNVKTKKLKARISDRDNQDSEIKDLFKIPVLGIFFKHWGHWLLPTYYSLITEWSTPISSKYLQRACTVHLCPWNSLDFCALYFLQYLGNPAVLITQVAGRLLVNAVVCKVGEYISSSRCVAGVGLRGKPD